MNGLGYELSWVQNSRKLILYSMQIMNVWGSVEMIIYVHSMCTSENFLLSYSRLSAPKTKTVATKSSAANSDFSVNNASMAQDVSAVISVVEIKSASLAGASLNQVNISS